LIAAIGVATAIDQEGQLDKVSGCVRDASLGVKRHDLEVRGVRGAITQVIPAIDVERPSSGGYVAKVLFYSDDFEAEKARPRFQAVGHVEQLENVLIVKDEEAPHGLDSVRACVRQTLAG
jgi:hypothetical protein